MCALRSDVVTEKLLYISDTTTYTHTCVYLYTTYTHIRTTYHCMSNTKSIWTVGRKHIRANRGFSSVITQQLHVKTGTLRRSFTLCIRTRQSYKKNRETNAAIASQDAATMAGRRRSMIVRPNRSPRRASNTLRRFSTEKPSSLLN